MANASNEEAKRFSRACILESLLLLMREKDYEKITLTEIAGKAGVSRNAIYRNFETKDAILKIGLQEITDDFLVRLKTMRVENYHEYLISVFTHLCEHREIGKTVVEAGMSGVLFEVFMSLKGRYDVEDSIRNYYETYRIGALFLIYITWLETGCRETPEDLAAIVLRITGTESVIPTL